MSSVNSPRREALEEGRRYRVDTLLSTTTTAVRIHMTGMYVSVVFVYFSFICPSPSKGPITGRVKGTGRMRAYSSRVCGSAAQM